MKLSIRNALIVAGGLVALSLPANAVGTKTIVDPAPALETQTTQLAQRRSGSFTDDGFGRIRDTAAGGVGFKKSKKKKAPKTNN
jgi:hypothetical protein